MGLSDDQRALLRLLARREEGYEDIAALMGLGVEEVRARVREALAALDEEGSAAGPVAAGDPPPPAVAEASSGVVPPAAPPAEETPPPKTAEPRPSRRAAPSRSGPAPPRTRIRLPKSRRRLVELVGGALVVVLLVLFATGAVDIGGDSDSDSDATSGASAERNGAVVADSSQLTQAILEPVDGGEAKGRALFGRIGKNVVLQVQAQNLEPSPRDQAYSVWLYRSPKLVLRVGAARVGESGQLAAQFPIPAELLGFVANGAFRQIAVSLLSEAEYESALAAAKKREQLPGYLGTDTLRGQITGPAIKQ